MRIFDPVLVPCDEISRESKTNKATLVGVFDRLIVHTFPSQLDVSLYVSFYLDAENLDSCPVHFVLHSPDHSTSSLPPVSFAVRGNRVEADVRLTQVPIPMPGAYRFALHVDSTEVCSARVNVDYVAYAPSPLELN